ncbi:GNAT family N-acetyltransferase [Tabrizicola sp.]|uniref:GNAT family N-acetyltransferase n=1 Tax=Tabrizicola sp. TaxID=2005166 RepID=UPI0027336019|nr:GNAT family N-acetyltransferase [Tabrizicola sp.]MDP3195494.1 GNAT family N-acetyltransferase [Tabrizicola sp.]
MIREQGAGDRAAVEARLAAHLDQTMFPLTSLRTHGLVRGRFASPHDHAIRLWRIGDSLIAVTRAGMILPLLVGAPDLAGLPAALMGLKVTGAVGPAASARPVIAALGLTRLATATDRDEPGFALDLARLAQPDLPGTILRPIVPGDLPLVTGWRETYIGEVLGSTGPDARAKAEADIADYLTRDSHRLLLHNGKPVAMTGFNASQPEIVQIGGVYTPAHLRGRGYARRAVALHLSEARAKGVSRAVLFAASDAAAQAYRALGFQPTAPFTLFLLSSPTHICACP